MSAAKPSAATPSAQRLRCGDPARFRTTRRRGGVGQAAAAERSGDPGDGCRRSWRTRQRKSAARSKSAAALMTGRALLPVAKARPGPATRTPVFSVEPGNGAYSPRSACGGTNSGRPYPPSWRRACARQMICPLKAPRTVAFAETVTSLRSRHRRPRSSTRSRSGRKSSAQGESPNQRGQPRPKPAFAGSVAACCGPRAIAQATSREDRTRR